MPLSLSLILVGITSRQILQRKSFILEGASSFPNTGPVLINLQLTIHQG